jgi:bifunctional pyridoxal-dependent enzyme with beta-cystathionase and maltose regulon repressor activities
MTSGFEDLDLDRRRRRRSEKWRLFPPDVLPAFIAEMDYDLAGPVAAALRAVVDLDDCGYATPDGVGEAFAAGARGYLRSPCPAPGTRRSSRWAARRPSTG